VPFICTYLASLCLHVNTAIPAPESYPSRVGLVFVSLGARRNAPAIVTSGMMTHRLCLVVLVSAYIDAIAVVEYAVAAKTWVAWTVDPGPFAHRSKQVRPGTRVTIRPFQENL
jgi:hypothetical protein